MTDKKSKNESLEVAVNVDGDNENNSNLQYMLNSPLYMSSVVRRQLLQEMVKSLPANVQKRINALRNIELDRLNLEAKFFEEVSILNQTKNHMVKGPAPISNCWIHFY